MEIDKLGDKIGVGAIGLDREADAHLTGNGEARAERLAAVNQTVIGQ